MLMVVHSSLWWPWLYMKMTNPTSIWFLLLNMVWRYNHGVRQAPWNTNCTEQKCSLHSWLVFPPYRPFCTSLLMTWWRPSSSSTMMAAHCPSPSSISLTSWMSRRQRTASQTQPSYTHGRAIGKMSQEGKISECNAWGCFTKSYVTIYAIYFTYRYFHDFGLGGEVREGLISQVLYCLHYYE